MLWVTFERALFPGLPFVFLASHFPPAPHATSIKVSNRSGFSFHKLDQVVVSQRLEAPGILATPPPASRALSCHQIRIIQKQKIKCRPTAAIWNVGTWGQINTLKVSPIRFEALKSEINSQLFKEKGNRCAQVSPEQLGL